MTSNSSTINLGFTDQTFERGVHVCQIFSDDDERQDALLAYLLSGLQSGERACCFSEKMNKETIAAYFRKAGFSYENVSDSGAFSLHGTRDIYFQGGRFDPDRMLDRLASFYKDTLEKKYPGGRVIGEMTAEVEHIPGGSRLLEYEARVSMLLRTCPVTSVCQYDARAFSGKTIMDILKVHPYMIIRSTVVRNPFFIQPEEYLKHIE